MRTRPLSGFWPELSELARIVAVVQNDPDARVGSAWYFIRDRDGAKGQLYRLTPGSTRAAPRVERVYGRAYGIEGEDLDTDIEGAREYEECPGLYHIPDLVHRKLTALEASG
jgi:hypothetical protein